MQLDIADLTALTRFQLHSTQESVGAHGIPFWMLRRLVDLGALRSVGGRRFQLTVFGNWCLSPADPAATSGQASLPYHFVERQPGGHGNDFQIWKGKRRIADVNSHAFSSRSAEREQAELIVKSLNNPSFQAPKRQLVTTPTGA